jgi:hypothetical protein
VSEGIRHKDCGGEIVSEELIYTGYEIVSDGAGGWDYAGNISYHVPDDSAPYAFACTSCGWKEDQRDVLIDGFEMVGKS